MTGVIVGLVNGGLVAGFGVQPFIVTRLAARSLALIPADNASVGVDRESGNEEAARLTVYAICGRLAGRTGAFLAAKIFTGTPSEAVDWELSTIAAVVVGGTLLTGGVGSVWTTLVGVVLLGLIINLLGFENLDPYWQSVICGGFLLVVVVLQRRLTDRRGSRRGG